MPAELARWLFRPPSTAGVGVWWGYVRGGSWPFRRAGAVARAARAPVAVGVSVAPHPPPGAVSLAAYRWRKVATVFPGGGR